LFFFVGVLSHVCACFDHERSSSANFGWLTTMCNVNRTKHRRADKEEEEEKDLCSIKNRNGTFSIQVTVLGGISSRVGHVRHGLLLLYLLLLLLLLFEKLLLLLQKLLLLL